MRPDEAVVRSLVGAPGADSGHWTLVVVPGIDESVTVRLEITRRAELAIRALARLTDSEERVKASALADGLGTTVKFVPQVLGPLVRAGWVQSDPGPTGGYRSLVGVGAVSVLQVIEAVDGATNVGRCVVADRACQSADPCVLHVAWAQARTELVRVLQSTPVSAPVGVVVFGPGRADRSRSPVVNEAVHESASHIIDDVETDKEQIMRQLDVSMTLAEAVDAFPQLAREFEKRELDYCCGGGRTIDESCTLIGLDPSVTVAELSAISMTAERAEWTTMTADALVDHLEVTHHRYLWDELPRVTALVDKIVTVHGERHPELADIAACYAEVRADLEPHLTKEERVLFPMIRELAVSTDASSFHCGSLRNPISVMLSEHDAVGDLLAKLRRLTSGYTTPADGCATYAACFAAMAEIEADTHLHIHKENNVLFPMVLRLEAQRAAGVAR